MTEDQEFLLAANTDIEVNNGVSGEFRPRILAPTCLGLNQGELTIRWPPGAVTASG